MQGRYDPIYWAWHVVSPDDVKWAADLGFGGVGVWGADRNNGTMTYFFTSPTLDRHITRYFVQPTDAPHRWAIFGGDVLTPIAREAHRRGLKVMMNMESVNPWHWKAGLTNWTPELLRGVTADIQACGADRWFSEVFNCYSDLFFTLADESKRLGLEFQEGADPAVLYSVTDFQTPANFAEKYRRAGLVSMYYYYFRRDIGFVTSSLSQEGALGFGFAKGWSCPSALVYSIEHDWGAPPAYWPGLLRASCLIAALQFRVDDIMIIGADPEKGRQLDVAGTKAWVADLVARQGREKRPTLNVVAHLTAGPESHWDDLTVSIDAIACGAFHSGYNLVCTTTPQPEADAYWVYTRGRDGEGTLDLTQEIMEVLGGPKPAFLQCGWEVPSGADLTVRWREALRLCGVNSEMPFGYGELPQQATYEGATLRYTGYRTKGEGYHRTRGTIVPAGAVTGTALVSSGDVPLLIGKGNAYLVPASCIHWQLNHAIGRLLGNYGTAADSNVWGIAGEKVSAFLAIEDTELVLDIPRLDEGARLHVTRWDKSHQRVSEEAVVYHPPFRQPLHQYDLVVITAEGPGQ